VSFAAVTLCVASQQVFIVLIVYFVIESVRKLLDTTSYLSRVMQVPVTTAWSVPGLRIPACRINSLRQATRSGPSAWGMDDGLKTLTLKRACYELIHRSSELARSCEDGNEPSGYVKGVKFLEWLSDCQLLTKDSALSNAIMVNFSQYAKLTDCRLSWYHLQTCSRRHSASLRPTKQ
jgi:hypothetical protein